MSQKSDFIYFYRLLGSKKAGSAHSKRWKPFEIRIKGLLIVLMNHRKEKKPNVPWTNWTLKNNNKKSCHVSSDMYSHIMQFLLSNVIIIKFHHNHLSVIILVYIMYSKCVCVCGYTTITIENSKKKMETWPFETFMLLWKDRNKQIITWSKS